MNNGGSSCGGFPGREAEELRGLVGNNPPVTRGLLLPALLALVTGSGLILVSLVLARLNEAMWLLEKRGGDSATRASAHAEQESLARLLADVGRQREEAMRAMEEAVREVDPMHLPVETRERLEGLRQQVEDRLRWVQWLEGMARGWLALTEAPAPTAERARTIVESRVFISGSILLCFSLVTMLMDFTRLKAQSFLLWLGIGPATLRGKWERRYGLPMPLPPADVDRAFIRANWLLHIMFLIPAVLAAFVVLLSPRLYDPLADPPPSVSAPALKLAESWHWVMVVFGVVLVLAAVPYWIGVWRHRTRLREMESWLDRGIPVCLACGGLLEGVEWRACPRCGELWSRWYPAEHGRPVLPGPATSGPR